MEVGDIMQDLILEPKYTIVLKVQLVVLLVIVQAALVFRHWIGSGQFITSIFNIVKIKSIDTAGDEMVDAGVIFVCAAGNDNQRLGIGR